MVFVCFVANHLAMLASIFFSLIIISKLKTLFPKLPLLLTQKRILLILIRIFSYLQLNLILCLGNKLHLLIGTWWVLPHSILPCFSCKLSSYFLFMYFVIIGLTVFADPLKFPVALLISFPFHLLLVLTRGEFDYRVLDLILVHL